MPQSIKNFERIYFVVIAIAFINAIITFPANIAQFTALTGTAASAVIATILMYVISFAVGIAWIFLISRKRNNFLKWLFVVIFALSVIPIIVDSLAIASSFRGLAALIQILLQCAAMYFLFTKESRAWFKK